MRESGSMRKIFPLSSGWLFIDSPMRDEWLVGDFAEGNPAEATASRTAAFPPVPTLFPAPAGLAWIPVDLPHTLVTLPFNHFDEGSYQKRGTYSREFDTPRIPEGGRVFLDFEGVAVSCRLWLNGRRIGHHSGPYTPFSVDITEAVRGALEGRPAANRLFVEVDAREDPALPPFGGVVDYLVYGGIYRAVHLRVQGPCRIERVHARPRAGSAGDGGAAGLSVDVEVAGAARRGAGIAAFLKKEGAVLAEARAAAYAEPSSRGGVVVRVEFGKLGDIALWDIDSPTLYDLEIVLEADGEPLDSVSERIGFRQARFTSDGFYLNGRRIFLRGLNRHQSWPYAGYAMGPGAQRRDAEILKRELGAVIVRTSHYPQSRHFLEACDELGLLVFAELPGWQHIGDKAWKDRALADLEALILRDRNHPSVILWGVRVNESPDDRAFYEKTNALSRTLDPDRQTGGVRCIRKSDFLEDVYTFNDFTCDGGSDLVAKPRSVTGLKKGVPYLITEHNGHMFPTKRFDQEERLAEQARRHAAVLDASMGDPGISGAIGWCAFDYNTHKDFGSGDRVCYHGVSDMFRIPKYAAAVYASQVDPKNRIVLEPASFFSKGERSAARILPVEVYTNCDAVELYRSGERIGRFHPDRKTYPNLQHPPVLIDDFIGDRIDGEGFSPRDKGAFLALAGKAMAKGAEHFGILDRLRFGLLLLRRRMSFRDAEALVLRYGLAWGEADDSVELVGIVDGGVAIRKSFGADARAEKLEIRADAPAIRVKPGDEWDAVRVVARALDQYGNLCPFAFEPLRIEISGAGRLIGPCERSLLGGATAFWVAGVGACGDIEVKVTSGRFGSSSLALKAEIDHE